MRVYRLGRTMDIRGFFSRKRPFGDTSVEPEVYFTESDQDASGDGQTSQPPPADVQSAQPLKRKCNLFQQVRRSI